MEKRTLQAFLSLADTLHFGRAGDARHMSVSTMSRIIRQLEDTVGARLFERDNRSVALTAEGVLFQRYARESMLLWQTFESALMRESEELHGEIAMYCSVTASHSFLYQLLRHFRKRHPRIRIKLHTGDPEQAIARVLAGQEEVSIGARPARFAASLAFKSIADSPLVFIAPRDASAIDDLLAHGKRTARWAKVPMIVPERGVARDRLDGWFRARGIRPQIWAQVAGNEAIVSMVSLGGGVGVVPRIVLDNSPLADRVRPVANAPALAPLEVGMFVLKKRLANRLVDAFWSSVGQPRVPSG